jgi:hypothetical protein
MKMKFEYELNGSGWADVNIEINGQCEYFSVSYLSNALKDLVDGLVYLIPGGVPDDEVRNESSFKWHFEPAGAVITLKSIDKKILKINLKFIPDMFKKKDEEGEIILDEECNLDDFVEVVVKALDKIIKKCGIVGYRETWSDEEFPLSGYLKLKSYLISKKSILCNEVIEDGYREYYKSNLKNEIDLIMQEIK